MKPMSVFIKQFEPCMPFVNKGIQNILPLTLSQYLLLQPACGSAGLVVGNK